jgi:hypothetical protein
MDRTIEDQLRRRIAELEAENKSLRDFNELLKSQRKEYLDIICGPVNEADLPTEEQMIELMKTRVPMEDVFRELGIPYGQETT